MQLKGAGAGKNFPFIVCVLFFTFIDEIKLSDFYNKIQFQDHYKKVQIPFPGQSRAKD